MKKIQKKVESSHAAGLIAAGVAGLTAAAVGAYYLYGHMSPKKKNQVKGWMLRTKGEVLEKLEKAESIAEHTYTEAVDVVSQKYQSLPEVDKAELEAFAQHMKKHWKGIKNSVAHNGTVKKGVAQVKKGFTQVKKAAKKAVKK